MEGLQINRGEILSSEEGSDAIGWGFSKKGGPLEKFFIKHPELGAEDIRIKVLYSGICQSDVSVLLEKWSPGIYPIIPGHEIIGTIYAKGDKVKSLNVGDLVGVGPMRNCCEKCDYCHENKENLCTGVPMKLTCTPWIGGFSSTIQIPYNYTFKIPDGIAPELAPPLMCAGGTVFAPLKKFGKVGLKVAILGMGGLGHLAIQFACKMGMKTYAVSTSDTKKDLCFNLGAHEYVNTSNPDELKKFNSEAIDLMINTTSVGDVTGYMRALKKGSGVFVQIGGPDEEYKFSIGEILMSEYTLVGSAAASRDDMKLMLEFSKQFGIKSMNEYFSFEDFPKALEKTQNGKPNFRVVVDIKSFHESNEKKLSK